MTQRSICRYGFEDETYCRTQSSFEDWVPLCVPFLCSGFEHKTAGLDSRFTKEPTTIRKFPISQFLYLSLNIFNQQKSKLSNFARFVT